MTFRAKYDGRCPACGEQIARDEVLEWDDDEAVHLSCLSESRAEPTRATCPRCWQVLSVTGACGCDPS